MGRIVLIQSVLTSIPVHLLSSLNLPKGILARLKSIMASFLWSAKSGVKKRHWCSWNEISKPKEEGGLGIRKLEDVQKAFRIKQVWQLFQGTSLWSSLFAAKYLKQHHPLRNQSRCHSRAFTALAPFFEIIASNSQKLVGKGNSIDFWCDNWSAWDL